MKSDDEKSPEGLGAESTGCVFLCSGIDSFKEGVLMRFMRLGLKQRSCLANKTSLLH